MPIHLFPIVPTSYSPPVISTYFTPPTSIGYSTLEPHLSRLFFKELEVLTSSPSRCPTHLWASWSCAWLWASLRRYWMAVVMAKRHTDRAKSLQMKFQGGKTFCQVVVVLQFYVDSTTWCMCIPFGKSWNVILGRFPPPPFKKNTP